MQVKHWRPLVFFQQQTSRGILCKFSDHQEDFANVNLSLALLVSSTVAFADWTNPDGVNKEGELVSADPVLNGGNAALPGDPPISQKGMSRYSFP